MPKANILIVADHTTTWEMCWERVLCLPGGDLPEGALFAAAAQLVRNCQARTDAQGIAWFKNELADGRLFVAEQLIVDPDDPDWHRVGAVLAGAFAGLQRAKDVQQGLSETLAPMGDASTAIV